MAIFTDDLRTESPSKGVSQIAGSFGEALGATVGEAVDDFPTMQALGINELNAAKGGYRTPSEVDPLGNVTGFGNDPEEGRPAVPMLARDIAAQRIKAAGLDKAIKLPDQDSIAEPALNIMIDRARERRERQTTIERGPDGILMSGTSLATSFLVGALDPINLASAFVPVMGELRYGKLLASAGEGAFARAGVRASVGAAEGVVGQALLEPLDWWAHTQDGRDFGMADVLQNLAFGAALGGIIHPAGGFVGDRMRARKGEPLYPFAPGEAFGPEAPAVAALADLPPQAHEDAIRGSLANLINGEPVRAGEMLDAAATVDPRIAESVAISKQVPRDGLDASTFTDHPERLPDALTALTARAMEDTPPRLAVVVDQVQDPASLSSQTGLDLNLEGYKHTVDTYAIRHALKQHGDPVREAARGNVAITAADIAAIPDVLRAPDRIERVEQTNKIGNVLLRYVKKIGDTVIYVEEVRTGRRELAMQTMYKKPAGGGGDLRPDAVAGSDNPPGLSSANDRSRSEGNVAALAESGKVTADVPGNPKITLSDVADQSGAPARQGAPGAPGRLPGALATAIDPKSSTPALTDGALGAARLEPSAQDLQRHVNDVVATAPFNDAGRKQLRDAAFRELSRAADDIDAPDVLEASRAADALRDPIPTKLDERVAKAEQADAEAKSLYDMMRDVFTPEEREHLDDVLRQIDRESKDVADAIKQGGSCIFRGPRNGS